jgi:hypothetical protein
VLFEAGEPPLPELSVGGDPGIDLPERIRAESIHAPLAVDADVDEPGVAQHSKVLGHERLAHREPIDELAHGPFAVAQQVEDAAAVGFGEELERGDHGMSMPAELYACQVMDANASWAS